LGLVAVGGNDGQDVGFAQNQQLVGFELEFGARILGEQDALTLFDIGYDTLTAIENAARTDARNLALLRFFPSRYRAARCRSW